MVSFVTIAAIFAIGAGLLVAAENQIIIRDNKIKSLQKIADERQAWIDILQADNFKQLDEVAKLKNQPTPTPIVKYVTQTQYGQAPDQNTNTTSHCYSDTLGGQYCTSSDGIRTHCTPDLVGGMTCR